MWTRFSARFRSRSLAARNAVWLSLSQLLSIAIPLVELPFLSRALGPNSYGYMLLLQGAALSASVAVEYGFHYSGMRKVATAPSDRFSLQKVVGQVTATKLLIATCLAFVLIPVHVFTAAGVVDWRGVAYVALLAASYGFSPMWFFFGKQKIVFPVFLDLALRSTGLILIIFLVTDPEDIGLALSIQAGLAMLNTAIPTAVMFYTVGARVPTWREIWGAVTSGWHFFVFKGASGASAAVAAIVLGISSTTTQIGLFAPTDKIVRAVVGFVNIILTAYLPHAVANQRIGSQRGETVAVCAALLAMCLVLSALVSINASKIVEIVFGEGFLGASQLLSWGIFIIPIKAASSSIAMLWLIPRVDEAFVSRMMVLNLAVTASAGLALTPYWGADGMVVGILIGELSYLFLIAARMLAMNEK